VGAIASASPAAAVVVALLLAVSWSFISRTIKKGRELQERQRYADEIRRFEAHQAEQRRVYAEQQAYQQSVYAEQQRVLAEQDAERQRIEALQRAERERFEHARQAEQERILADQERLKRERWDALVSKYGEAIARRISAGRPWVGCEYGVLIDMLGPPAEVDEKVLKTKTKHTYKYRPLGGKRYGLRIYLDDGIVTGWDDKGE